VNDLRTARAEFWESAKTSNHLISVAKSVGLFLLSYMPKKMQTKWPHSRRQSIGKE
jgi:hypothetical protein